MVLSHNQMAYAAIVSTLILDLCLLALQAFFKQVKISVILNQLLMMT